MKRKLKTFIAGILFFMLIAPLFGETKISSERQQFIDYALTLQGTRYVWGGKSPATGLDCSGFVEYAAQKSVKKSVTGTAAMMYKNLEHITPDEREPGDLIFFAVQSNGKYNVTHVGIYLGMYHGKGRLDGERIFVHAASDGKYTGVTVNSINDNYWKKHFYGYARFLPPTPPQESVKQAKKQADKKSAEKVENQELKPSEQIPETQDSPDTTPAENVPTPASLSPKDFTDESASGKKDENFGNETQS